MKHFESELVRGGKSPYTTWTFLLVPEDFRAEGAPARFDVRGTLAGHPFRGTVARGEGVLRLPLKKAFLEQVGVRAGDVVEVSLELDTEPRPIDVPPELAAVLKGDRELARLFDALPPSMRRAWAAFVGDAKRPETRERRVRRAPAGIRARAFPPG